MSARILSIAARGRTGLWFGLALFAALVAAGWIGFIASDDVTYARGAYGWLEQFPYVGGHGTIRYLITIPMALAFLVFGENEFAMVLPSLIYVFAFLIVAWSVTRNVAGAIPAFGALVALVTSPLIAVQSTIAGVDVIEMAFLFGSVMLTWSCLDKGPDARKLLAVGALAGCAFLTRETAIFVVPFFGLLFLAGHRMERRHYLGIPVGFLTVWALEITYLTVMTGDPLYRFNISTHHDSTIDRTIDLAGNVIVNPLIDPLLVLLVNQEFMALFFLAAPLTGWLCFGKAVEPRLRHFARIVALFALVWFACVAAAQTLLPLNPRYFMVTSSMACLLTGLALGKLLSEGTGRVRLAALAGAALLVGGNLVGITVENREPVFGERTLAALAADMPDARIVTDPMTRYRAVMLLRWEHAESRIAARKPRPGDLYFYNPARAQVASAKLPESDLAAYQPGETWTVLRTMEPEPTILARTLERTGISAHLPQGIWRKLRYHSPPVTLYRVR